MLRVLSIAAVVVSLFAPRDGSSSVFSSRDRLSLNLEAPFEDLFAGGRADNDYAVDGTVSVTGAAASKMAVRVSLRGHTSRRDSECSFPKLKLTFTTPPPHDSPFAGLKTLKIGTHCGEGHGAELTERFGRLPNELSPPREALAYHLLDAIGLPTLRVRPARIRYSFIDSASGRAVNAPIERNALLIENEDEAMARVGASDDIGADAFTSADKLFSITDSVDLTFAESLLGNFDWCVLFTPNDTYRCDPKMKLWNVIAARTGDGKARPMAYDFDVAGIVTGSHRWFPDVYNESFLASRSHRAIEVVSQLQRTRTLFDRPTLEAARRRFNAKKDAAYRTLEQAGVDDSGRQIAREYLDAFFQEIGSDEAFYRPVVVKPEMLPRATADPSGAPVCAERGAIPVGTPVTVAESRGAMRHVVVLDALWHWAIPHRCPPIKTGAVWIPADAIGRDFPAASK